MNAYPQRSDGRRRRRAGSALVLVMCMCLLLAVAATSLIWMTGSAARASRSVHDGVRALAIAEAGVGEACQRMSTNYMACLNTTFTNTLDEGTYTVAIQPSSNAAGVVITSTGQRLRQQRTTAVELLVDRNTQSAALIASGAALLAECNITLDTGAPDINGTVRANGNCYHNNGNTCVNGDVIACGVVEIDANAPYGQYPGASRIAIPDYRPFDAWMNRAKNGGLYYSNSVVISGKTLTPSNGVVYCAGDITFNNRCGVVGTLVAAGSIALSQQWTHTPYNTNWPCLLAGMNISLHNRDVARGVVWAANDIDSRNNRAIYGPVIALGSITGDNRLQVYGVRSPPAFSPTTSNPAPQVVVGGWLK